MKQQPSTVTGPAPLDELRAISDELKTDSPATAVPAAAVDAPAAGDVLNPPPAPMVDIDPTLQPITREQAVEMATDVWGFVFDGAEQMTPFRFKQETRDKAVAKTFPVIVKHSDKLPWWYKKWKEEIDLGVFVGSLIFNCAKAYVQAKRIAAEQARVAAPRAEAPAVDAAPAAATVPAIT